jgi:hypothetical protein
MPRDSPLRQEEVLLYAKVQSHKEALRVLVQELDDHDGAERYCLDNSQNSSSKRGVDGGKMTGMEERSGGNELLLLLLHTYLFPELDAVAEADPVEADLERYAYAEFRSPALLSLCTALAQTPACASSSTACGYVPWPFGC